MLCLSFLSSHIDIEFFWCHLLERLSLCIFVPFIRNHWAIAVWTSILPAVLYPYSTCLFWASTMLFVLLCLCSIWKHVGSLSKIFCASIEMIMWYFCFILWFIYWVVCIEQSAFWDEVNLFVVDDFLNMCLYLVCWWFTEGFSICFYQGYRSSFAVVIVAASLPG